MIKKTATRAVPEGYHAVMPWIISRDTPRLIDFIAEAFDGKELARLHNDDGSVSHAEVRVHDSVLLMFDARPHWPETPAFLRLYVDDGEATFARALHAGATPVTELTYLAFGDRIGRVRDPLGNLWWIQERMEDLDFEEMARRAQQPEYAEAMRYVQSAELVQPRPS
jgi:PhnB protein